LFISSAFDDKCTLTWSACPNERSPHHFPTLYSWKTAFYYENPDWTALELVFHPKALKDIKGFSKKVRARIAGLLDMERMGLRLGAKDFKYMKSVGEGVYE